MGILFEALRKSTSFRFGVIAILGTLLLLTGLAGIILSVIELFQGRPSVAHYNETVGGLQVENPLWPSSGKGFWVGLVLVATGIVGIIASLERTPPSIVAFTALSSISTVLSFYVVMTCIIPVQYDTKYSDTSRPKWQLTELIINSILMAVGSFGAIIGALSTLLGLFLSGYCVDQRNVYRYTIDDHEKIIKVLPEKLKYGI
ncbi:unnamed protein product [Adineta steineri]|uniref:Uncharacterized protein n=1 Tax=Adineta steineri TaxID=433720 RepID=A0A816D830_9BILA|nr:unnamed protein product [Adineta steineri]CAF1632898.1 unnamed protein product [Adineta steineri]